MTLMRYLLVGVANTLVGLSTIYFAMYILQLGVVSANAFGYSIGILLSFALNKTWTFSNGDHVVASFLR
jgi:putative flippase GtrA